MQLVTIKRDDNKTPKDMLVELYDNNKGKRFIVIMSKEWFKEFLNCEGIEKNFYEPEPPDYLKYSIHENDDLKSTLLLKIEVKYIGGRVIITDSNRTYGPFKDDILDTIFYFE